MAEKKATVYNEPDVRLVVFFDSLLRNEKKSSEGSFIRVYKTRGGFEGSELVRTYYKVYVPEYVMKEAAFEKLRKGNEITLYGKVRSAKQVDVDEQILSVNIDKVKMYNYDFSNEKKADKNYGYSPEASSSRSDSGYRKDEQYRGRDEAPRDNYRREDKPAPREERPTREDDPFGEDDPIF